MFSLAPVCSTGASSSQPWAVSNTFSHSVPHRLVGRVKVRVGDGIAIDEYGQTLGKKLVPMRFAHLLAGVGEPGDVLALCAVDGASLEPTPPAKRGVGMAEGN
jgi:hypothetical protein